MTTLVERFVRTAGELGYQPVLLRSGSKRPTFERWQQRLMDLRELLWWIRRSPDWNWGILLSRQLTVVDQDAESAATTAWLRRHGIDTSPFTVRTKRGLHRYFRMPAGVEKPRTQIRVAGLPIDLLGGNRVVVGPGSVVDGFTYTLAAGASLVAPDQLPTFPAALLTKQEPPAFLGNESTCCGSPAGAIHSPERYVMRVQSVQGCNGSAGLVRVVLILKTAGRSAGETLTFLREEWNPIVPIPAWSNAELERAVRRHYGLGNG